MPWARRRRMCVRKNKLDIEQKKRNELARSKARTTRRRR